jgi:hypothetical protein
VQSLTTDLDTDPERATRPGRRGAVPWRSVALWVLGGVGLFAGYLRMSRTVTINADGSSNALQAWDMLHGNVLLHGWTVTDVSFYTTELIQYALLELVYGLRADVIHVAAAMSYTLIVLLAAALAKGRSTGVEAAARMALAVLLMLLPAPQNGYVILLGSPDHLGTGVPLLVTWLVLDRAVGTDRAGGSSRAGRWLPWGMAVLLAWGQIGDPLVMFVGVLPLVLVAALGLVRDRAWRATGWRGALRLLDTRLLLAGIGSVLLARGFLWVVHHLGGFHVHAPTSEVSPVSELAHHGRLAAQSIALIFGGYLPDLHGPANLAVGILHIAGILVVVWAVVLVTARALRGLIRGNVRGDYQRVAEVMAAGILVNVGAFVVSTLPVDLMSSRQVAAVLPLGAALAGRVCGARLTAVRRAPARLRPAVLGVLAGVVLLSGGVFVARAAAPSVPALNQDVAHWLASRDLRYGLGGYWSANNITLIARGRVQVVPVTGTARIMGYRWESHAEWYDPARHDARFIVINLDNQTYGTVASATAQFGTPVERHDFGRYTVLVYDHNLLVGLPAYCVPEVVARMADC